MDDTTTPPQTSELKALLDKYSPYLLELRKKLLSTAIVFAVATLGGFAFYEQIIKFLIRIFNLEGVNIVFTSPFQFINLAISCGIATGLVIAFPHLTYQILAFLKPALKKKEYKYLIKSIPFSVILFLLGFSFGLFVMKWQIELFLDKSVSLGIGNMLDISKLLSSVLLTSVILGIGFQFPIIISLLMHLGLVTPNQLKKQRVWVYLGSFFFTILLPADSLLSDLLLALPLVVLFELTLLLKFPSKKMD